MGGDCVSPCGLSCLIFFENKSDLNLSPGCNGRTEMIHSSLRMKFTPEKLPEAREILCSIVERIRVSQGCLGCDVYQHLLEPGVLLFGEWWDNHADQGRHGYPCIEGSSW